MVWIIIVNYRTADLTVACLRSIATQTATSLNLHVAVIDNASGDNSVEKLQQAIKQEGWQDWVSVTANALNGGFAYGNNTGIKQALCSPKRVDYLMLLNPDTIVHIDAISTLVDFMESHPKAGICGSLLENADGGVESSAHNAHSPLGELINGANLGILSQALSRYVVTPPVQDKAHKCEWVSGASLIIRREVFEKIGLLDEEYFLYFEEADFCLRARKSGWQVWLIPESRVIHLEGAATGIRHTQRRRAAYWYDSRRRYFNKHFGLSGLILADLLWSLGRMTLIIRRALGMGSGGIRNDPQWFAFDLLWGDFRSFFSRTQSRRIN